MDDQLLQELYGVEQDDGYTQDEDLIKQAQAELVEAVADEAGIDLNEMDDEELEKFASYVLSPELGEESAQEYSEDYANDGDSLYAEADQMGRVMAHAYADEQMKIASDMEQAQEFYSSYDNALVKVAHDWDMIKEAQNKKIVDRSLGNIGSSIAAGASKATGYRDIKKAIQLAKVERNKMRYMKPDQLAAYKDSVKDTKAFKAMSKNQRRAAMLSEIKDPTGHSMVGGKYRMSSPVARRQAIKNLAARGAGKVGLGLAAATAAGVGLNKLRNR